MADGTHIEWARHPDTGLGATWNPITGCTLASDGCKFCYAARLAATRLKNHPSRVGLAKLNAAGDAKFTGEVRFNEKWLTQPLGWKKGRGIFVCAHGDLFAPGVPDEWIDRVFAVMALAPQHLFFVLTKRPERAREYLSDVAVSQIGAGDFPTRLAARIDMLVGGKGWTPADVRRRLPLEHVWLGCSVEDQANADVRIPQLLAAPAARRFLSVEPLLGRVVLNGAALYGAGRVGPHVDWVIVGGESGTKARPMHPDWVRSLRDQCHAAGVDFFFKQWGGWIDADSWYEKLSHDGIQLLRDGKLWQPPQPLNFELAEWLAAQGGFAHEAHSDGNTLIRVGKEAAGRLLDGALHNAMPPFRLEQGWRT